jgi:NAD(P)H-flavin reductase
VPPIVSYENTPVSVEAGVSVLEALEAAKFTIPYSCRAGLCHSCMMHAEGEVPAAAQQGLSVSQIAQNYFLACCCHPHADLTVRLRGAADPFQNKVQQGKVVARKKLNESVLALFIQVDFRWFAGQYLTLWKNDLEGRSYSIASRCDEKKIIELHIKRHDQGQVSRWLHDEVSVDDMLTLSEPIGDCFYTDEHQHKPIVMACTGTGLAPLYGILQEALAQQHAAPITLYMASGEPSGLYYRDELTTLAEQHDNVYFIPMVRRNPTAGLLQEDPLQEDPLQSDLLQGDIVDVVKHRHPELNGHKIFICGAPDVVKKIQRNCFFAGAAISDILVDAFEVKVIE